MKQSLNQATSTKKMRFVKTLRRFKETMNFLKITIINFYCLVEKTQSHSGLAAINKSGN